MHLKKPKTGIQQAHPSLTEPIFPNQKKVNFLYSLTPAILTHVTRTLPMCKGWALQL